MNRLEGIKKRLEFRRESYIFEEYVELVQIADDTVALVEYLLSALDRPQNWWDLYDKFQDKIAEKLKLKDKLEQAEKDLQTAYDYISQTDQELTKQHLLKALKQLRED